MDKIEVSKPEWPKISIVTPSYNQGKYIEETILSVVSQGYPNLEYIIIDGGSNDTSIDIIKRYEKYLSYWVSEPDKGQYDAINKGMGLSTGDICTYLNADDVLHFRSLFSVAEVFTNNIDVDWIGCVPNHIDETGRSVFVSHYCQWNKFKYYNKDFRYIQQEGTFWRRSLWYKAGGYISTKYKLASDLELWSRFFQYTDYHVLPVILASFRARAGNQKSKDLYTEYLLEVDQILNDMPINKRDKKELNLANLLHIKRLIKIPIINKLRIVKKINDKIYSFPKPFVFNHYNQSFRR